MAFDNIKNISSLKLSTDSLYFLDANVWVYAMNSTYMLHGADKGNPLYTKLFFSIIDSELKPRPKIVLCSLLMSEIINTYLRKMAMPDYIYSTYDQKGIKPPPNFDYKLNYRKTKHFSDNYKIILNDIKSYHESIFIVDDTFSEHKPFQFSQNCPDNMDFNDYYYYLIAKKLNRGKKPFSFITNDGDFAVNDFNIYTSAISLLELSNKK